jgi:hypothetical protein
LDAAQQLKESIAMDTPMSAACNEHAPPKKLVRSLKKVNRQNKRFRKLLAELNRFVDAVAALAPDVAERAASAVE